MRRLFFGAFAGLIAAALGTGSLPVAASGGSQTIVQIAAGNPDFSTLVAAVTCTGLVPALNGTTKYTVFAPTNEAFAKLNLNASNVCSVPNLKNILLYHVAPGTRLASSVVPKEAGDRNRIKTLLAHQSFGVSHWGVIRTTSGGTSKITKANIRASNGVIHVIDTVLIPGNKDLDQGTQTIVQIAAGNSDFSTLVAAVTCTNLVPALNGTTDYTVFAPTNEAFAKLNLNAGNVCSVPNLKNILLYHVITRSRTSYSIVPDADETNFIETLLDDQSFRVDHMGVIHTSSGGTSMITTANILASNGVIHIVDTVLVPGHAGGEN